MVTHRTKYGWMALGGLLCLFGIVLACKFNDGNRVMAQGELPPPPTVLPEPPPIKAPADKEKGKEPQGTSLPPIGNSVELAVTPPPPPPEKTSPPAAPPLGSDPRPIVIPAAGGVPAPPSDPLPTPPPPKAAPDEPPLAPAPGPVVLYKVPRAGETFQSLARKTLGGSERWGDIHKLNPTYRSDTVFPTGAVVRLPGDACVEEEETMVRPLPTLRPRTPPRPKSVLPLTGTYSVTLDESKALSLPRAIVEQLGNCDTVLVSPGSERCLWLTNQAHLDRLQAKLDRSSARPSDVTGFKRLYYAQTARVPMRDGRVTLSAKLAQFANLGQEVVLVGIDDHFEVWDAARWRRYTQAKKASARDD